MKIAKPTPPSSGAAPEGNAQGVSRRQIVRAGLSAAPVIAVLKSNTVLAGVTGGGQGNGVTTSAFASLQANQGRVSTASYKTDCQVITPAQWQSKPSDFKKKKFQNCGFVASSRTKFGRSVTLGDVLELKDSERDTVLARYVVAAYLTALQFHDDRDVLTLTTSQCNAIWNGQGSWSPFAGAQWDYAQTMAYFETIYGGLRYG